MKAVGEAAVDLPWILPSASSLVGLTRPDAATVWSEVRFDPGCVLLLARASETDTLTTGLQKTIVLEKALDWLRQGNSHFVDWNQAGASQVQRICVQQGLLAQ